MAINITSELPHFSYKFSAGPLPLSELQANPQEGNCRLAIQYYFFKVHNLFLEPEKILNPYCYKHVGVFVVLENKFSESSFHALQVGDIIYAEKRTSKTAVAREVWIISLHSAIYLGNNSIWHATSIDGKTSTWPWEKFLEYYKFIAAKRILDKVV